LAKVERVVQLGQDNELRTLAGKLPDLIDERLAVGLDVAGIALLNNSYFQ
jgi:hypothetical protein